MKQLISIIVPIYNAERYLSQCIESIANQTYQNLQIILVDDGSTDHSREIMGQYATEDNRIVCIHQANGGVSSARNAGLDVASGKYLTFCDADDWLESNYVEKLLEAHVTGG